MKDTSDFKSCEVSPYYDISSGGQNIVQPTQLVMQGKPLTTTSKTFSKIASDSLTKASLNSRIGRRSSESAYAAGASQDDKIVATSSSGSNPGILGARIKTNSHQRKVETLLKYKEAYDERHSVGNDSSVLNDSKDGSREVTIEH